jgi:hypothetical protein
MPRTRRTLRQLLVVAAVGVAVLGTACGGVQSDPTGYGEVNTRNEGYYGNFMFGCTGVEANADGEYVDWTLENPDFCTCVYEGLVEKVPFSEMQELERAQADAEPGAFTLPRNVDAVRQDCARLAAD